jgi:hypothetical protein
MNESRFQRLLAAARRQRLDDGFVQHRVVEQLAASARVDVDQVRTLLEQAKWGQLATLFVGEAIPEPAAAVVVEPTLEERVASLEQRLDALSQTGSRVRRAPRNGIQ